LLLGAAREVVGGRGDLIRPGLQAARRGGDGAHGAAQAVDGAVEVFLDLLIAAFERSLDVRGQVAFRQAAQTFGEGGDDRALLFVGLAALGFAPRPLLFDIGDVGGELDHLERLAGLIEHGVVGRLDPDLLPALADPQELGRDELALVEPRPEFLVSGALRLGLGHEQAVVTPHDLVGGVTNGSQEVGIGADDRAVQLKLDDRLGTLHGVDLRFQVLDPARLGLANQLLTRKHCYPHRGQVYLRGAIRIVKFNDFLIEKRHPATTQHGAGKPLCDNAPLSFCN
jgi:hypothetical protein